MFLMVLTGACGGTGVVFPGGASPSAGQTSTVSTAPPVDHRLVLSRTGGRCLTEDGGGACEDVVTIERDGWVAAASSDPTPSAGSIEPATFERLVVLVDEGLDELTSEPFSGTCPTAHDGQEITIELWDLPHDPLADAAVRTTSSCTHDWDRPEARRVIDELRDLLDEAGIPFWVVGENPR